MDINRAFRFINLQKNSNQDQNHYMYYKHTKMKNIDFKAQPFLGPGQILCDNKSVVLNTTLPSSTLKKKHNAIAYHQVREAVVAKVATVNHIEGKENVADILTKPTDGPTFRKHVKAVFMKL